VRGRITKVLLSKGKDRWRDSQHRALGKVSTRKRVI
jgi:hypothetical protein